MTLAARILAAWGLLVGVIAVVAWIWTSDRLPPSLLTAVACASLLLAAYVQVRKPREPAIRYVTDVSLGPVVLALGAAVMLNGVAFGYWLVLAGVGVGVVGLAVLVGELASGREAHR
jgi:hypothetical protein